MYHQGDIEVFINGVSQKTFVADPGKNSIPVTIIAEGSNSIKLVPEDLASNKGCDTTLQIERDSISPEGELIIWP